MLMYSKVWVDVNTIGIHLHSRNQKGTGSLAVASFLVIHYLLFINIVIIIIHALSIIGRYDRNNHHK